MIAAHGSMNDGGSNREAVFGISEEDDGLATVGVYDDEGLVHAVVSPVPEVFAGGVLLDAPAESPEEIGGEPGGCVVGAVRACGIDGDLRGLHLEEG